MAEIKQEIDVRIIPNAANYPVGKLADAEIHWKTGPMAGLKLVGFAVWESKKEQTGVNVTFPARSYNSGGEKRNFTLLRATGGDPTQANNLKALITKAYFQAVAQVQKAMAQNPGLAKTVGSGQDFQHAGNPATKDSVAAEYDEAAAGVAVDLASLL